MENTNQLIKLDTRINLLKTAITVLERAYKSDVSKAVEAYQGGNFEIAETINMYAVPIEELKKQLYELYYQRNIVEVESEASKEFFELLKTIRGNGKTVN